jgi:hypothetical protein
LRTRRALKGSTWTSMAGGSHPRRLLILSIEFQFYLLIICETVLNWGVRLIYSCSMVQGEVCHVLFIAAVQYTPSSDVATTPPVGSTELPICPVCIGDLTFSYLFCFGALQYNSQSCANITIMSHLNSCCDL